MISVIIPTLGRPGLLHRMLVATQLSTRVGEGAEILVVDTGSQAETRELCACMSGRVGNIRHVECSSRALHAGRHAGVRASSGDVLLFADDDIVPSETWIAAMGEAFSDPDIAMAGGVCLPDYESVPPVWVEELWQPCEGGRMLGEYSLVVREGPSRPVSPFEVFGCNFAIRRRVLLDAGGFHPDGVPSAFLRYRGDGETAVSSYVQNQGLKCLHVEGAAVRHHVSTERMSFSYLFRRSFAQGVSDSYAKIRRNGKADWVPRATRIWERLAGGLPSSAFPRGNALPDLPEKAGGVIALGHGLGLLYHQREVRRDPKLLEWVLRKDYWDAGLPGEALEPKGPET